MHEDTSRQINAARALATYRAMQRYLYVADGASLYRETYPWPVGNPYSFLWPFVRALTGTLSLTGMLSDAEYASAVKDRLVGLTRYWHGKATPPGYDSYVRPPLGNGGDKYYDDNAWVAHALVEQYRLGLATSLDRAEELFDFARSGWDRQSGGVYWVQQGTGAGRTNHDRGAGLNAGYARLGFHLRELTGRPYDADATRMVDWVHASLDTGTGLYWNAIRGDGSIDTNLWTYVQGEMLAARALQYRLTRDVRFLRQAESIARATLATFGTFTGQPPSFNAMYFQSLLLLSTLTDTSAFLATIQTYADWAWNPDTGARDPTTGLFHFTTPGSPAPPSAQPAHLQDQGAMLQIYALLAWDPANYAKLT